MTEPHTTKLFIEAVSFGETFLIGGTEKIADEDMILMHIPTSETDAVVMAIDVPTAQKIATDVATACGRLISKRVDDKGRKLHLGARLAALAERPSPLPPSAPEDLTRIDFDASSDTDGDQDEPVTFSRGAFGGPGHRHTHFAPGLTYGCPACSEVVKTLGNPVPSEHFVVEEESITRVPFNAEADTDGDLADLMRNELPHTRLRKPKLGHNHVTREIRTDGTCPACNEYLQRHGIPEEEQ